MRNTGSHAMSVGKAGCGPKGLCPTQAKADRPSRELPCSGNGKSTPQTGPKKAAVCVSKCVGYQALLMVVTAMRRVK